MGFGLPEILVILVIVLIIFGAGKLPRVMGDLAKGVRAFRSGLKEGEDDSAAKANSDSTPPKQDAGKN